MKVQLDRVTQETPVISTLHFVRPKQVSYLAGQFVELSLPLDGPTAPYTMRQFTLSSSPTESHLSITTKLSNAYTPFKQALRALQPGDNVDMSEPLGDFVLPIDASRPLFFIAGGIGITPFRSMLKWLEDSAEHRHIKLMYAVNNEDDIIFSDDFKRAQQHATIIVEKPSASWGGERGQLTTDMILSFHQPSPESLVYLSGPEAMIAALERDLRARGLPQDQLVTDLFLGYTAI